MDDALLDFCLGINGFYRLWETGKPIDTRNQDILHTPVLYSVQNGEPELGAFILPYIHTQDIFPPGHINPYGDIHGLLYDTSLAAYMEVDGIQEYHCVNLFQWPFLPFLYDRQDFVRDTADGTV